MPGTAVPQVKVMVSLGVETVRFEAVRAISMSYGASASRSSSLQVMCLVLTAMRLGYRLRL